jgi:hypothetical protein
MILLCHDHGPTKKRYRNVFSEQCQTHSSIKLSLWCLTPLSTKFQLHIGETVVPAASH